MDTLTYLKTEETNHPRELRYGVVREPPAPLFSHQDVVLRVALLLRDHVTPRGLGVVAIAPLDVVLDAERHLIVQPDVLFVSASRLSLIRNQVWGAPDLVVEVSSPSSQVHDRGEKRDWYRRYGVAEYWLVDLLAKAVTVFDFSSTRASQRRARGTERIRSSVLPELDIVASAVFE